MLCWGSSRQKGIDAQMTLNRRALRSRGSSFARGLVAVTIEAREDGKAVVAYSGLMEDRV